MERAERYWQKETEQSLPEYQLSTEIEILEERAQEVREAWDAWQDFNQTLHALNPPSEIVQAWDVIRPWLEAEGRKTREQIDELDDRLEEVVNYY